VYSPGFVRDLGAYRDVAPGNPKDADHLICHHNDRVQWICYCPHGDQDCQILALHTATRRQCGIGGGLESRARMDSWFTSAITLTYIVSSIVVLRYNFNLHNDPTSAPPLTFALIVQFLTVSICLTRVIMLYG
jgi:hypothetical protein